VFLQQYGKMTPLPFIHTPMDTNDLPPFACCTISPCLLYLVCLDRTLYVINHRDTMLNHLTSLSQQHPLHSHAYVGSDTPCQYCFQCLLSGTNIVMFVLHAQAKVHYHFFNIFWLSSKKWIYSACSTYCIGGYINTIITDSSVYSN